MADGTTSKRYAMIVHCANVVLREDGKGFFRKHAQVRRMGAFTTRVVSALDQKDASRLAIESAINELKLNGLANMPDDPPRCELDGDIRQLADDEIFAGPVSGFTFYREEEPQ